MATRIIFPDDVINAKTRIDAKMQATLADVGACTSLDAKTVSDFRDFFGAWRKFYCASDGAEDCTSPGWHLFGLGGQMDDCETWEAQLYQWQQFLGAHCTLAEPASPPPTPTAQQGDSMDALATIVKWGAIGALGVVVVREIGLPRLFGKKKGAK